ncbi:D-alanyl-D-alanine carboxypeptidase family protein [Paenibacillus sp. OAE614]|uniref:D-alanyl-D-alanine carboxypeptidase family protein n=1 Tax=Paenibacillus sp. OAE614 TaxID=2663804 RepID=UPI001A028182
MIGVVGTEGRVIHIQPSMVHRGHLVLINSEHPLRQAPYSKSLAPVESLAHASTHERVMRLERSCLQQLETLLDACGGRGGIGVVSGYRTAMEQQRIYDRSLVENGEIFTASYVARPGESEHQTGLAADVGDKHTGVDYLCPSFPEGGVYASFRKLAAEHGFIQRYKQGKEHLTHIACEPWHFRYVGVPHAIIMEQYGMCLEEYTDYLKQFTLDGPHLFKKVKEHLVEMYYVPVHEEEQVLTIKVRPETRVECSGNNVDGCIITVFHDLRKGLVG